MYEITTVAAPVAEEPVVVNTTAASVEPTLDWVGVKVAAMVSGYVPAEVMVVAVVTSTPPMVTFSVVAEANKVVVRI